VTQPENQATTLFDRIGGAPAIAALIDEFYTRVLTDPELAPFFSATSMAKLRRMQQEFFAAALDGPIRYSGLSIAATHYGRGIRPRHLRRFVEHLLATLRSRAIDEADAFAIVDRISTYADEVIGTVGVDG
jgi:hemoglobin